MTAFAMGFLFIVLFTVFVGVAAVVFISFDAETSNNPVPTDTPKRLYNSIRRVNTKTIETVDSAGIIQTWIRSD